MFWVGNTLEPFLQKPLESIASKATTVTLMDVDGLKQITFREGGLRSAWTTTIKAMMIRNEHKF